MTEHTATLPAEKLTATKAALVAEYRKRKNSHDIKRIASADLQAHLDEGWTFAREMKRGVRVTRPKPADEILENQLWVMLYLLGYEQMNIGRHFRISVDVDGHRLQKQIDVFALDGETAVVAECKSALTLKGKSLQKELSELDSIKRQVANAIRAYRGAEYKPKILWLFVTSRIRWTESDLARAKDKANTYCQRARA